jgi:formyl-CoA transferase
VIKIERPEGDFARGYDSVVHGESAYFVWLNRGKESVVLDLAKVADKALFAAMIAKADVLVQNLKPGAIEKLGFPIPHLRREHPRLIVCSVSGYGEDGPYAARKAYDMLIQAESGLASVTGGPEAPSRVVGVAKGRRHECIRSDHQEQSRGSSGVGARFRFRCSTPPDWMTVPLLRFEAECRQSAWGLHTRRSRLMARFAQRMGSIF